MSAAALRVGVIGTGVMGADHAAILDQFVSGATVTRVSDVNLDRAAAVAAGLSDAQVAPDAAALVEDAAVDAVLIASSDATHADLVLACLAAGKPVLCEKPLAPSLGETLRVAAAAQANGRDLVSVGFMRRFDPGYVELKRLVRNGSHGAPLVLHCVSRGVGAGPGTTTEYSVTGAAVHEFDTVPWLLDAPVVEVSWHAPRCSGEVTGMQDPQLTLLRTADGALTTLEVFLNARSGYDIRCEVVCERGQVSLAEPARVVVDAGLVRSAPYAADWRPRFADAYRLQSQAWVDAVRAGTPTPLASVRDGLVAAAVSDAVLRSVAEGGGWVPVEVPIDAPHPAPVS